MQQATAASPDAEADGRKLLKYQARAFVLTWCSYAAYYLTRKPIGVVKSTLQDTLGLSTQTLAWIDTGYLTAYAVGQFINGLLGDRLGARRLLGLGMLGTAACAFLFGASSIGWILFALWLLNGFFQSSGWPGNVKAMTPWFGTKGRGTVMGVWGTCYQVGGIVGTALATWLLANWGWRSGFYVPSILVALVGVALLLFLVEHPRQVGLRSPAEAGQPSSGDSQTGDTSAGEAGGSGASSASQTHVSEPPLGLLQALRLPGILNLGAAYFCLKLIRYTILMWYPFYLNRALGYDKADAGYLSVTFEIGGILGAIIIGYLSDKYVAGRRVLLAAPMVLMIAVALWIYQTVAGWGMLANGLAMAGVGFMLFGPDSLLSGAAAQDLGGTRAASSAAGVINGMGSVGAILQGFVTAYVSEHYGWNALFFVLMGLATLAFLVLLPTMVREARRG